MAPGWISELSILVFPTKLHFVSGGYLVVDLARGGTWLGTTVQTVTVS